MPCAGSFLAQHHKDTRRSPKALQCFAAAQRCGFHDAALAQIVLGFTFGHGE
jgi:hypothetical protein